MMASRFFVDVTLTAVHERYAYGVFGNKEGVFIPSCADLVHPKWTKMTSFFKVGQLVAVIAQEQEIKTNGCQYVALSVCSRDDVIETVGEVTKSCVGADGSSFVLRTEKQGNVLLPRSAVNKHRKSLSKRGLLHTLCELNIGDRIKVGIMRQPSNFPWTVIALCGHSLSEEFSSVADNGVKRQFSAESNWPMEQDEYSEDGNTASEYDATTPMEQESCTITISTSNSNEIAENSRSTSVSLPVSPNSVPTISAAARKSSDLLVSPVMDDQLPMPAIVNDAPQEIFDGPNGRFCCESVKLTSVEKSFAYGLFGAAYNHRIYVPLTADLKHYNALDMNKHYRSGDFVTVLATKEAHEVKGCSFRAVSVCCFNDVKPCEGVVVFANVTQTPAFYELRTRYGDAVMSHAAVGGKVHLKIGEIVTVGVMRQPKLLNGIRLVVAWLHSRPTPSDELGQSQSSQETQTEQSLETKIASALMKDAVCFDVICRKHPELAREWTLSRLLTKKI